MSTPVVVYPECYNKPLGLNYRGHLNITETGLQCQRWDSQYPHSHSSYIQDVAGWFGVSHLADVENYCRNPDGHERPWCYTVDRGVRWQYCDLPVCPSSSM